MQKSTLKLANYELELHITHSRGKSGDMTVHTTIIYRYRGLKTHRILVPLNILAKFDRYEEEQYWDYVNKLDF